MSSRFVRRADGADRTRRAPPPIGKHYRIFVEVPER